MAFGPSGFSGTDSTRKAMCALQGWWLVKTPIKLKWEQSFLLENTFSDVVILSVLQQEES